jgi:hypothetical protein
MKTKDETELSEAERTQIVEELAEHEVNAVDLDTLIEMYRSRVFNDLWDMTDDELIERYLKRFKQMPFFS